MQTIKSKIIAFIWLISGLVLFGLIRRQEFYPDQFSEYIKLAALSFLVFGVLTIFLYIREKKRIDRD